QQIDARAMVRRSTAGDFRDAAERYTTCIMCGLCATVCDVGIAPQRVGLFAHRAVGRTLEVPAQLTRRIEDIRSGRYESDWPAALTGVPDSSLFPPTFPIDKL
ncbi:MAG: hypothetical protein HY208_05990, partial [Nitrospirae bacterium]|nr:hypothetical protein [Nitrospirota bacterium]